MGGRYDDALRKKLSGQKKLTQLWTAALGRDAEPYSYVLTPPYPFSLWNRHFREMMDWASFWRQPGACWTVETQTKRTQGGGRQHDMPVRVRFASAETVLRYLGMGRMLDRFRPVYDAIAGKYPALSAVCLHYRENLLTEAGLAENMMRLADYFQGAYKTDCYLREIDIPGVDTKFMENHRELTASIFQALHPELSCGSFRSFCMALRIREKAPEPNIYIRSLDPELTFGGMSGAKVTGEQLAKLAVPARQVFVVENKINGMVFPSVPGSLVLFGAGNGIVPELAAAPWLQRIQRLWYWGDLDREGFAILARFRGKYPQVRSFLMSRELLARYADFLVEDTSAPGAMPDGLTPAEQACWQALDGAGRLEQERIPMREVTEFLRRNAEEEDMRRREG